MVYGVLRPAKRARIAALSALDADTSAADTESASARRKHRRGKRKDRSLAPRDTPSKLVARVDSAGYFTPSALPDPVVDSPLLAFVDKTTECDIDWSP